MIALRLGQSCAIPFFHDFSEAGRTSFFKEPQLLIALFPILVTESGRTSFFNKSQSLNAPFPILITEFGTLIVSIADIEVSFTSTLL